MAIWVFSDLHGCYNLWKQIQATIGPNDTAYCLGDCIDRGPDGVKILLEVLADPRITLLKGNHEEFLYTKVPFLDKEDYCFYNLADVWLFYNGGAVTWDYLKTHTTREERIKLIKTLRDLPELIELDINEKHFYLSHAGFNPWVSDEAWKSINGNKDNRYLWDRSHVNYSVFIDKQSIWDDEKYINSYVIHGHTPLYTSCFEKYLRDCKNNTELMNVKIPHYDGGHKINLDLGSFATGRAVMLDLTSMEERYFYDATYDDNACKSNTEEIK